MYNKENGVYYTPSILADYLAEPLIKDGIHSILDPSYGEGSLLLAAERGFKNKNIDAVSLFGCDIKPVNGLLKHLPQANLLQLDFFDYPTEKTFQTILMNPPYVRQQTLSLEKIKKYRSEYPALKILNNNADLWAYFLIKALSHMEKEGSIGAILPWAFLQADYAVPLRKWLTEVFGEIKLVALREKYFEKAEERVVVLWLNGYGQKCKSIKIASSPYIDSNISFTELSLQNWASDRVLSEGAEQINQVLSRYKSETGFTEFSNFAEVKIGVVTAGVKYFIRSKHEVQKIGFKRSRLKPILKSSDEFGKYLTEGKKSLKVLISLKAKDHLIYRKFIKEGVERNLHLTAHSKQRDPWYAVKVGKVPDAFFHYRVSKIPFLLPNLHKVQCTNSIHRIYFKKLGETEKKWLFVSLLSAPSQLSIEVNSKTYGRGVLKIEPKSLKNTLVITRKDRSINPVYRRVINLLAEGNKELAMVEATAFLYQYFAIPEDLQQTTDTTLINLQSIRLLAKKDS